MASLPRDRPMPEMADNSEQNKKTYEEAMAKETNMVVLEDFEDEPEKLVRAKKAMLHCICLGMDATTKDFRTKVKELAKGNNDIPCHDDVYKFEEDEEDQDDTGQNVTYSRTRVDKNKFRYQTGQGKRLAVYIGIGEFEKRGLNGESGRTGYFDSGMNRKAEEQKDRQQTRTSLKALGFTFKSNGRKTTKVAVDNFIEKTVNYAEWKEMEIIVVVISSHGEEVIVQDENNQDNNVIRHRILLEDTYLYTDDLVKLFDKIKLRGIPTLFFIQACRSGVGANEKDVEDKGVISSGEVENTKETEKVATANLQVHKVPLQGVVDDINEAKQTENNSEVKPPKDDSEAKSSTETHDANPLNIKKTPDVDTTVDNISQLESQPIPCIEDSLIMFASAPGKAAYRTIGKGGWLITSLCSALNNWESNPDQDLLEVLTGVIGNIAFEKETQEGYKSAACLSHNLTDDIYLCLKK